MNPVSFKIQVTGLREAAIDAAKLDSVLKSIGRTAFKMPVGSDIQKLRGLIPGLAVPVSQWLASGSTQPIRMMPENFLLGAARAMKQMGPVIPPAPAKFNWKLAGIAAMVSPFSPWLGARTLNSALMGGGGGAGGIGAAIFGPGGVGGMAVAFTAIRVVLGAVKIAFEQLNEAVKRGTQLYVKSASLGMGVPQFTHLQRTLEMVGLPANAAEKLSANSQFLNGAKMTPQSIQGAMIGAGRGVFSKEEMQAIVNLSKDVADAWNRTAVDAKLSSDVAYANFKANVDTEEVKSAWHSLMENMAAEIYPVSHKIKYLMAEAVRFVADQTHGDVEWLRKHGVNIPQGLGADFKKLGLGPTNHAHTSAWERMGFVIGGFGGGHDYARQTAQNTKDLVGLLRRAIPRGGSSGGSLIVSHNTP